VLCPPPHNVANYPMVIRFVWPDCTNHFDKPGDAFWVECDEGEARMLLSPGADLPHP
jgi:hypothetical protein